MIVVTARNHSSAASILPKSNDSDCPGDTTSCPPPGEQKPGKRRPASLYRTAERGRQTSRILIRSISAVCRSKCARSQSPPGRPLPTEASLDTARSPAEPRSSCPAPTQVRRSACSGKTLRPSCPACTLATHTGSAEPLPTLDSPHASAATPANIPCTRPPMPRAPTRNS